MSLMEVTLHDPRVLMRRRINRNPELSLDALAQLKSESMGFPVTVEDLAQRIFAINIGAVLPPPPRSITL